jgi:segregation and condensation protein A
MTHEPVRGIFRTPYPAELSVLASLREDPYQVRIPAFEGPLDLLLQLIEREKLDISSISLAQVADQFLVYVRAMEQIGADTLADFLVIASRLVWIKSHLLLPQPSRPGDEEQEEDPAEALARQLREYKRFKDAAASLRCIEEAGYHTYLRSAPPPEFERHLEADTSALVELLAAAQAALASAAATLPPESLDGMVVPFTLTIHDQISLIQRVMMGSQGVSFKSLLLRAHHRVEIIVTLLAVLELIKRRQIEVTQEQPFGDIMITPVPGSKMNGEDDENGDD